MDRLEKNNIVKEVQDSFLEYSMSVIVARALPDLRDGLKPVHRRILYSMYESGAYGSRSYQSGSVLGLWFVSVMRPFPSLHKKRNQGICDGFWRESEGRTG